MDANKACSRKTCCSRHFQHAKADGPDNRPMYFLEIGKTGDQWLKCKDGFWVAHTKSCSPEMHMLQTCTEHYTRWYSQNGHTTWCASNLGVF